MRLLLALSGCLPGLSSAPTPHREGLPAATFQDSFESGKSERKSGHTSRAIDCFLRAAALAQTPQERAHAFLFASGSQIRLFQYRAALHSADLALRQALLAHDNTLAGAASSNRATIYLQLGSDQLASEASREAVTLLSKSNRNDYLARALLNHGDIESKLGDLKKAGDEFRSAIRTIHQSNLPDVEALAEDHLGLTLSDAGDFAGATDAFRKAVELRTSLHDRDGLAVTKQHLAELAYRQGHQRQALALLKDAEISGGNNFSAIPSYWSPQLRGKILLALGQRPEALLNFRKAVRLADAWRQYALPGDLSSIQTAATLHTVYRDFVQLAAELSLERHDPALSREAAAVLATSRAATLREQRIAALDRQMQLPPHYFELLSLLQSAEAALALGTDAKQTQTLTESVQRTRNELADLENNVGITQQNSSSLREKTLTQISLTNIQRCLSADQLLLSFSLGNEKSFLWGVSRNRVELYQLPAENIIASHSSAYFAALQKGPAIAEGVALTRDLLRNLDASLAAKKEWLIVADGVLLNRVPFASLPVPGWPNSPETLVASHSLRFLPSEQILVDRPLSGSPQIPQPGKFIGVADPVYNRADSRLPRSLTLMSVNHVQQPTVTLARLAGSAGEVRSAAKLSGMSDIELLTGINASQARLQAALAVPPSLLHFAVHVISAPTGKSDAALALSLTPNGVPELLTKEAIARLRVPGALVVLSGCASQQGEIVPSAGLIGLGRAWLLAGAAAVIVSAWPTPDDSGEFFSDFYGHLHASDSVRTATLAQRASAALRETQLDMQRSAGYRSSPSFWAAYSMISEE